MLSSPPRPLVIGVGAAASVAIAPTGHLAHLDEPSRAVVTSLHIDGVRVLFFAAAIVLTLCWLVLGRAVRAGTIAARTLRWTAAIWSVPMLFVPPIASRDAYAYAGQSQTWLDGHDPYLHGPSGRYLPYVGPEWQHSTSPYGPVWVLLAAAMVLLAGSHVLVTVLLMRVLCALGVVLVAATLPRITRTLGGDEALATWLLCASPLTVAVVLGGAHNDALVGGLIGAALWFAFGTGKRSVTLWPAAALLTVAVEIKLPAAICLAFLPLLWRSYSPAARGIGQTARTLARLCAEVVAIAAVVAAVTSFATGLGVGWLHDLNSAESGAVWLSVPVLVGLVWTVIIQQPTQLHAVAHRVPNVINAVTVLGFAVLVGLWFAATRRRPAFLAAVSLAGSVLLSVTVQPWYVMWAMLLAAALITSQRGVFALAIVLTALLLCMHPGGSSWLAKPPLPVVLVVSVLVVRAMLRPTDRAVPSAPAST